MQRLDLSIALLWAIASIPALVAGEKPNLLLVLSDDHSLPHLGVYGCENCQRLSLTPHLDAFAEEGIRFERTYTAAPQCAPSRTAIFTGRSPVGLGSTRFSQPARPDVPLFTDLLREQGYWVGLDGRHQHLEGRTRDLETVVNTLIDLGMKGPNFERRFDHFVQSWGTKGDHLPQVGARLNGILDQVPDGKPFFLYFGFSQPHRGWGEDHDGIDPSIVALPPDWPDLPEVRIDYARYLAELRDLDRGFAAILEVLDQRNLNSNTVVLFMGDNGEALLRGKGTLYNRGINVPLLVRWPGKIEAGRSSQALISGVDLAPTFLEIGGAETPSTMKGKSFLPELLGQEFEPRDIVFAERGWHHGPLDRSDGFDLSRSVTGQRYHFIYNTIPERAYGPVDMDEGRNIAWDAVLSQEEAGLLSSLHERILFRLPRPIFELYDLQADPFQLSNLAGQAATADVEQEMRDKLDEWMVRESDFLPLPSHVHALMRNTGR